MEQLFPMEKEMPERACQVDKIALKLAIHYVAGSVAALLLRMGHLLKHRTHKNPSKLM